MRAPVVGRSEKENSRNATRLKLDVSRASQPQPALGIAALEHRNLSQPSSDTVPQLAASRSRL